MGFLETVLAGIIVTVVASIPAFVRKPQNRRHLVTFLRRGGDGAEGYRRALSRGLGLARSAYGDTLLGWKALGRCFQVALVYPVLCLGLAYLAGAPVRFGEMSFLPGSDGSLGWPARLGWLVGVGASGMVSALLLSKLGKIDEWVDARAAGVGVPSFAAKISIGAILGLVAYLVTENVPMAAFVFLYAAFYSVAAAVIVIVIVIVVGAAAAAAAVAVAAAAAVAVAVAVAVVGAVAVFMLFIGPMIGIDANLSLLTVLLAVFILLPLVNALFDHLSVAASRWLLGRAARDVGTGVRSGLATGVEVTGDVALALACLVGLAFFLPLAAETMNVWLLPPEARLDWSAYVEDARDDPFGRGLAGILMLGSTLIPTLLHVVLVAVCFVTRPLVRLSRAAEKLARADPQDDVSAIGALALVLLAFLPAMALSGAVAWFGKGALDIAARWMGEDGFAGLLLDAALFGGAQGAGAAGPVWLLALVVIVGGFTASASRA